MSEITKSTTSINPASGWPFKETTMEAGTETSAGKGRGKRGGAKGRMDADKQPAVKKPKVIADRMDELVRLHAAAQTASEDAKTAITKAAEDSGYLASAVRKIVTARAGEKFEEKHREVEQQLELFEEVGEV